MWNIVATFRYQILRRVSLVLGYRYWAIDYDNGSGFNRFEYDVQLSGPVVGLAIRF